MAIEIAPHTTHVHRSKMNNIYLGLYGVILLIVAVGVAIYIFIFLHQYAVWGWITAGFMFTVYFSMKWFLETQDKEIDPWEKGEVGESNVRDTVKLLPETYSYMCDVKPYKNRANNDVVVIGPTGIFSIEVKNVKTYGWRRLIPFRYYLGHRKAALKEAINLKNYLKETCGIEYFVKAILVLVGPDFDWWTKTRREDYVEITNIPLLNKYILSGRSSYFDQDKVKKALIRCK